MPYIIIAIIIIIIVIIILLLLCMGVVSTPWQCIHVFNVSDHCSCALQMAELIPMTTTSAARIIEELRKLFPTHGLPEQQMNFGLS